MISQREPERCSSASRRAALFSLDSIAFSHVYTMASSIIRMQTRRLGTQLRGFSTSPRQYARSVNSLGVVGSGQMVSPVCFAEGAGILDYRSNQY